MQAFAETFFSGREKILGSPVRRELIFRGEDKMFHRTRFRERFRAAIAVHVHVLFVCVSGMMKAG